MSFAKKSVCFFIALIFAGIHTTTTANGATILVLIIGAWWIYELQKYREHIAEEAEYDRSEELASGDHASRQA